MKEGSQDLKFAYIICYCFPCILFAPNFNKFQVRKIGPTKGRLAPNAISVLGMTFN
jgi:hypothetical protein